VKIEDARGNLVTFFKLKAFAESESQRAEKRIRGLRRHCRCQGKAPLQESDDQEGQAAWSTCSNVVMTPASEQGLCPLSYVANSRRARGASFDFLLPYPFLFGLFRKHQARLPRASKPSRPGRKHLRFAPGGP